MTDFQWESIYEIDGVSIRTYHLGTGDILHITGHQHTQESPQYAHADVEMYFNLSGPVRLGDRQHFNFTLGNMQHNLLGFGQLPSLFMGSSHDRPYRLVRVQLSPHYLLKWQGQGTIFDRFSAQLVNGHAVWLYQRPQPITRQILYILHDIEHCALSGILKQRFLDIKIQELFILQLQQAEQLPPHMVIRSVSHRPARSGTMVLSEADKEKLYAAKAYLEAGLENRPLIVQLARHVGTNEFKLKKGFKLLFGLTIFDYFQRIRMAQARHLLLHGDKTLEEVSRAVGYANLSNFANAFKAYHGYTPGSLQKRKLPKD